MKNIIVKDNVINITGINDDDFVSLTDIARIKNPKEPKDVVKNWMRLRSTLGFLGLWETLNNPDLNKYNTVNATHKIGSATSGLNFPTNSKETCVLKIEVFGQDDSSRIAIQTFYPNSTIYKFYVRRYTASNDTWSLWGKVSLVQDK